jgi:hypothetical protein
MQNLPFSRRADVLFFDPGVLYFVTIIYIWRKNFGQLDASDVKRLKTLEAENARLKKLLLNTLKQRLCIFSSNLFQVVSLPGSACSA